VDDGDEPESEYGAEQLGGDERGDGGGAIPAKVSVNALPTVTAGFAKEVEEVNQ
jgi:hypothetical protein